MRGNPTYTTTTSQLQGYFLRICSKPQQCKVCLEIWRYSLRYYRLFSFTVSHKSAYYTNLNSCFYINYGNRFQLQNKTHMQCTLHFS